MADENKELNTGTILFGRLPIYTTVDGFDADDPNGIIAEVNEALSIHVQNLLAMEYLYWYRRGVTPIYAKVKEVRPEINHKVSENIAGVVVDFHNGYFLTQPAFYISRKEDEEVTEKVKQLNEYLYVSGKQQADNEVVDWFHTVGKGDLFIRSNDDPDIPYEAYSLDPRSAFVVRSLKPGNPVVYAVHIVVKDEKLFLDVWDRQNVFTNTFGILTRGSIPLVRKDPNLPYGWVPLKTAMPVEWFPVNQLLGWAFDPNPDLTKKYYITDHITYPFNTKDFKWVEHIDLPKDSLYREFINRVYGPL